MRRPFPCPELRLPLLSASMMLASMMLASMTLAPGAWAMDEEEEDDEPSAFGEYAFGTGQKFLAGLNGIITWPADPVMMTVEGNEVFPDVWQPQVTGRAIGFLAGTLQGVYRLMQGAFDMVLCPFGMPMLSPEPRYTLIPFEHEG